MKIESVRFGVWVGLALLSASAVRAEEPPVAGGPVGALSTPEVALVGGTVRFESRSTFVPLTVCVPGQFCPKPEPYWALVLENRGSKVELNQPFSLGSRDCPGEVEYRGVVIRPGSQLRLKGKVQPVSPNYAFISDVREIRFVMD